jgi:hypothetical protein
VKARGLRWLGWMVLTPIAWANRVWALPFRTGPDSTGFCGNGLNPSRFH